METVANFGDLATARVAQSMLADAGIDADIPDEFLAGIDWQLGTAIQGVRVTVAAGDAEVARSLLSQSSTGADEDIQSFDSPADPDSLCPACHSDRIGPPSWKKRMKGLALLFFPALILYPLMIVVGRNTQCYECGHRWNASGP